MRPEEIRVRALQKVPEYAQKPQFRRALKRRVISMAELEVIALVEESIDAVIEDTISRRGLGYQENLIKNMEALERHSYCLASDALGMTVQVLRSRYQYIVDKVFLTSRLSNAVKEDNVLAFQSYSRHRLGHILDIPYKKHAGFLPDTLKKASSSLFFPTLHGPAQDSGQSHA